MKEEQDKEEERKKKELQEIERLRLAEIERLRILKEERQLVYEKELLIFEKEKMLEKVRVEAGVDAMVAQIEILFEEEELEKRMKEAEEVERKQMEVEKKQKETEEVEMKQKEMVSEKKQIEEELVRIQGKVDKLTITEGKDKLQINIDEIPKYSPSRRPSAADERDIFQALKRKPVEVDRNPKPFYPPWAHGFPPLYQTQVPSPPKKYKPPT